MNSIKAALATLVCGGLLIGTANCLTMDQKVVVGGRLVHTVRVSAGGQSPDQRVDRINERLNRIISKEPLAASNIHLRTVGNEPGIFVGRYLVTTVTQADADYNHTTPTLLAHRWLRNYQRALPQARPDQNWGVKER